MIQTYITILNINLEQNNTVSTRESLKMNKHVYNIVFCTHKEKNNNKRCYVSD